MDQRRAILGYDAPQGALIRLQQAYEPRYPVPLSLGPLKATLPVRGSDIDGWVRVLTFGVAVCASYRATAWLAS